MDIGSIAPVLSAVFAIVVACIAALVVGWNRGLRDMDTRSDAASAALIRDLQSRVSLLERERDEATMKIKELEGKVAMLEADLKLERAITKRIRTREATEG